MVISCRTAVLQNNFQCLRRNKNTKNEHTGIKRKKIWNKSKRKRVTSFNVHIVVIAFLLKIAPKLVGKWNVSFSSFIWKMKLFDKVFLWILRNFKEHQFWRTSVNGSYCRLFHNVSFIVFWFYVYSVWKICIILIITLSVKNKIKIYLLGQLKVAFHKNIIWERMQK